MCLPFIDPTDTFRFIKFITLITSILQLCTSGVISMIYFFLIKVISKSSQYSHRNMSQDISIFYPIVQLELLTSSNIVCWVPANIVYLSSLYMERYSIDLLIWKTIIVTPVKSLINPLLFIITTIKKTT